MSDMFDDLTKQERIEGHSDKLTGENIISKSSRHNSFLESSSLDLNDLYVGAEKKAFFSIKYVYLFLIIIAIILVIIFFILIYVKS